MKLKKTDQPINADVTQSPQKVAKEGGYNPSLLPFPASATASTRKRISIEGEVLYDLLVIHGVHFCERDIRCTYDVTDEKEALRMLINDREFDVYQTAPQCTATALIVSEIAQQANLSSKTRKCSAGEVATFEMVLEAMDRIADAIGPLADYRRFQMDVQLAAETILENADHVDQFFDATGKCKKHLLASQAARFSVVRGEGRIQSFEVIKDAKAAQIARAVRNAGVFDFSVGSVPIRDPHFMDSLATHLEKQRQNAVKLH